MASMALNMIVRNEAARIERCLKSVLPYVIAAVIVDTGSTDDTIEIIKRVCADAGVPCEVHGRPFINFKQARNAALECARSSELAFDYILLTDADMELAVEDPRCFDGLSGPSYDIIQKAGHLSYHNRRVVSRYVDKGYLGVTHEYLDVPAAGCLSGVHFVDHADGSNRADKFKRDIALLVEDLRSDPDNARSWFYLAQSYRDDGQYAQAAQAYKKRIELGGWDEEVFDARLNYAHCQRNLGDDAAFVFGLLKANEYRPTRAEPLYELAKYFRECGDNRTSLMFSEAGINIPLPNDALFVNTFVYTTGLQEEFSICAFYHPAKRARGFKVANDIALSRAAPDWSREMAKRNMYFYLQPLVAYAPSFKAHQIPFTPPDGYIAMNPSIANVDGDLTVIVRTVNYTITPEGRYAIRGTDGTTTNDNPIDTRNFMVNLRTDLNPDSTSEIVWYRPTPPAYDQVIGLEDMRLFSHNGQVRFSACVREQNVGGWCEQFTGTIHPAFDGVRWIVNDAKPMLPEERENEKNWMPWFDGERARFIHRLGTSIDEDGKVIETHQPELATDAISGSSQVIPFAGAYLAVVHESRYLPNEPHKRYYQHRFALMGRDGALFKLSMPFVLHDKQIEFVAGLCWHPDHERLLISYGVRDEEAWIAEIHWSEVVEMLT